MPDIACECQSLPLYYQQLVVNAAQALQDQGEIRISSRRTADEVLFEVCDTGCGIEHEHLSHIFEPFFTTKEPGEGTGLGLAVAYGIISAHHGRIEVESTSGQGSCFRVVLPLVQPK